MAYGEFQASGRSDANGDLTITIRSGRQTWNVQQVTVEMLESDGGVRCDLRKNGKLITPLVPNQDAAGGDPPIVLRPSDRMTVQWSGAGPNRAADVLVIYDDGTGMR